MTEATPRINATYLEHFTGQTVRFLGKVTQLKGENATIDAGGQISVLLNRDSHLQIGHAVEVVGKVNQDFTVKVYMCTDFGTNIGDFSADANRADFAAVDAVVDATHRYKSIFYQDD